MVVVFLLHVFKVGCVFSLFFEGIYLFGFCCLRFFGFFCLFGFFDRGVWEGVPSKMLRDDNFKSN